MRKQRNVLLSFLLILSLTLGTPVFYAGSAQAAKAPKLSAGKITLKIGQTKTIKVKNTSKKVKWSITSGKAFVSLTKKKKASVTVKAKKEGKAKVEAAVGSKKLVCTVTVKKAAADKDPSAKESAAPSSAPTILPQNTVPPQNTTAPTLAPTEAPTQAPSSTPEQGATPTPEGAETPTSEPPVTQEPLEPGEFRYEGLDLTWIEENIDPSQPVVAMSFDDGPGRYGSPADFGMKIQEALKQYNAHATFFYIGSSIEKQREEVEAAVDNGFEIANHSYDSNGLDEASLKKNGWDAEKIKKMIDDTNELLSDISGYSEFLFRAPNVAYGKTMGETIDNMPFIDVSCWSEDYKDEVDKDAIVANVKKNVKDGCIINMHSVYEKTAAAVPEILEYLKNEGIQVVSVSELFAIKGVKLMRDKIYFSSTQIIDKKDKF